MSSFLMFILLVKYNYSFSLPSFLYSNHDIYNKYDLRADHLVLDKESKGIFPEEDISLALSVSYWTVV